MRDNVFEPAASTVSLGGHIRWTNRGSRLHSVTSDFAFLQSELIPPSAWYQVRFDEAGTFTYTCSVHGETGTVIVQ